MSAPAIDFWRGADRGFWTTSGTEGLRLVVERRRIECESTQLSIADPAPWTVPVECFTSPSTDDLRTFLESRLKSIPEVLCVKTAERETRTGGVALHVWTSLSRDDRATRFRVYEIEQEIVDHFQECLFEFHSHLARESAPDGDSKVYEPIS